MASIASDSVSTQNNSLDSQSFTEIELFKVSHSWTIQNFSFCREVCGEKLVSPIFAAGNGSLWRIVLYPKGETEESKDYISLFLELRSSKKHGNKEEAKYRFRFSSTEYGKFVYSKFQISGSWGYSKYIKRDYLINETNNELREDDKLTIFCEMVVRGNEIDTPSPLNDNCTHESLLQVPECSLSDDLGSIFNKFGDVTIKADGKKFLVYKAILQARSPVFAAMFEHEMKERIQNQVVITDVKHAVLRETLIYIYTGKSPHLQDMAVELLAIADKYDLRRLKIMCEKVLCAKLNEENAIDTLMLAELHSADSLEKFVINFIASHSSYFLETQVWEDTVLVLSKRPNLVLEVTKALFSSVM